MAGDSLERAVGRVEANQAVLHSEVMALRRDVRELTNWKSHLIGLAAGISAAISIFVSIIIGAFRLGHIK